MKNILKVVFAAWLFFLLVALFLNHFGYSRQPELESDIQFPTSGTWRCDNLGISLFLDEGKCTFEDERNTIICYMMRERGSRDIYIHCYETSNPDYKYDHLFFSGKFIGIDGDVMYIKDHKTKTVHSFLRTG